MATLVDALKPRGGAVPSHRDSETKLVLSLTGDILAYRRCSRQYGLQSVRGYAVAHATQEFVGTFAHRALNRAFKRFRDGGSAPTNPQMAAILEEVKQLLKDQRRRPHSWEAVEKVGLRVMRLNRSFDTHGVYGRMVDTERTLQADDGDFVIEGKVDVIQGKGSEFELWDYKATRDPRGLLAPGRKQPSAIDRAAAEARLADYALQLRLYSHLHEQVHEVRPARCRLVFLNEVDVGRSRAAWKDYDAAPLSTAEWTAAEAGMTSPDRGLFFSVSSSEGDVKEAVESFRGTGRKILDARRRDSFPAPAERELPDSQTCDACDLRHSCTPACKIHRYAKPSGS